MHTHVSVEFLNQELYAIYKALDQLIGERAWDVVWRSGEVLFDDLEKGLDITETEPLAVMKKIGAWFERSGYVDKIEFRMVALDELEYDMYDPIIRASARRLISEGAAAPHFSTALMFAALRKKCGLKAEMMGDPVLLPNGAGRERWKLTPA